MHTVTMNGKMNLKENVKHSNIWKDENNENVKSFKR